MIADDFFAAGCVLGEAVARANAPDLHEIVGRALINGEEAGRGTGADVLGHPHNALAWLANHLAAEGRGLHAGQIVLTGSLVKTVWLSAGDSVTMALDGLGEVKALLSPEQAACISRRICRTDSCRRFANTVPPATPTPSTYSHPSWKSNRWEFRSELTMFCTTTMNPIQDTSVRSRNRVEVVVPHQP